MPKPAILALQDGTLFHGKSIGADGLSAGEVVFNTAMTGYQEILTDPSYCQQLITLTYPHIGNTGVNDEDEEATHIHASGLIIRDLPLTASNWRSQSSLQDYLARRGVVAIADIDTRKLTRCCVTRVRKVRALSWPARTISPQKRLAAAISVGLPDVISPRSYRLPKPIAGRNRPGRWSRATARRPQPIVT